MLPYSESGSGPVTLLFLHFFGGSSRQWTEVVADLSDGARCIAADLPGFGAATELHGFTVEEMVAHVCELVDELGMSQFFLVGHSMSGKVALAVANQLGEQVSGLILVAPSPPSPEPIPNKARAEMLALSRESVDGEKYIDDNSAQRLPSPVRDRSVEDFERASPDAWAAWLNHGSKEDWSARIGSVSQPALVVAAELDATLGPKVQQQLTLPHLSRGKLEIVMKSGHLIPMEYPGELANLIRVFIRETQDGAS